MKILDFNSRVFLAPMAGITDYPMRKLTSSLGGGVMVSEMVAINAMSRKNAKTFRIADVKNEEYPVVVQLVGGDEELFVDSVKLAEELGAHSIDINMGCPVKKIVNNKSGSSLMKDLSQASKIIKTVVGASKLKVSVKFRKGWDCNSVNCVEFAKMCEDSGASYVTIHGRTRSEFYSGNADWDIIASVKDGVSIPVIGNGDVTSPELAKKMLDYTNVDSVMIGRAALGNPWIISQTHNYLEHGIEPIMPSVQEVKNMLLNHVKELEIYYGARLAIGLSRKYVCWYCKNLRDARKFRERYMIINDMESAINEINNYFDSCSLIEE